MIQRLIRFSIEQRLFVIAATVLIMVLGVLSFRQLPIDVFPDPSPALVQIYTEGHGMAPEEVERLVSYPIEAAMFGLPRVTTVRSTSTFGLSTVSVYFEDGTDIYWARQMVLPRLTEVMEDLPEQAREPVLGPIATGLGLVYLYYLEGDGYTTMELRTLQDWLVKYELKSVPEVSQVLSIGGDVKQFQILVDPAALLKYDLTISDLIDRIRGNNQNVGASFIVRGQEEYIVRSIGLVQTIDDLKNTVVTSSGGVPVLLSSLARVEILPAVRRGTALANGEGEKVVGMVLKLFGSNTAKVIEDIETRIETINRSLPEGVEIIPFYNQAAFVRACFSTVAANLALGILLVIIVLFLFMGDFSSALVTVFTLPFSILLTFILMNQANIAADLMSFGGLAIAIGLIADAAIIYVENAYRHLQLPDAGGKADSLIRAGSEVARPLFIAIMIIVLVFTPIFTLSGVEGIMFRPMGFTISFALAGSLFFTLIIIPALAFFLLRKRRKERQEPWLIRRIRGVFIPFFETCLSCRRRVFWITGAVFAIGVALIPSMGREYMPRLQEGTLHLRVTMNPNASLEESISMATKVEQIVRDVPEVTGILSRIGRGEVGSHAHFVNNAEVLIQLKPERQWKEFRNAEDLVEEIEHRLEVLPGLSLSMTQPIAHNLDELITGSKTQLALKLYGEDFDLLGSTAEEIEHALLEIEGADNVQVEQFSGQNHIQIVIDRETTARYGLNISDVQETIEAAIGGVTIGKVYEEQRRFDIFLQFQPEYRNDTEQIGNLLISLPGGGRVPLGMLARIEEVEGARLISREQNKRFVTIQCNVRGRDIGSFVADARREIEADVDIPPEYILTWGGQFELQQRANRTLALIAPFILALVALLLFTVFSSMREVLVILINIPLALIGGVISLKLAGLYLSVPASIGFIAIFGIALEDGLVLLSTFHRKVCDGIDLKEAIVEGVTIKLRPVLMTTFTTIFGILPLMLAVGPGAEIYKPLATVVVGGLLTSTFVTLIVLPLVYQRVKEPVCIDPEGL
ncbi:efflux RND transporter permease subunit [Candidatus Zixiibacteriota bacterium]